MKKLSLFFLWVFVLGAIVGACGTDSALDGGVVVPKEVQAEVQGASVKAPMSELISLKRQTKLLPGEFVTADLYGRSIALSGDGLLAFVGAPHDDATGVDAGALYILENKGTYWAQRTMLLPQNAVPGELFGTSVSVSGDFIAVGAPGANGSHGTVYVFERNGGTWSLSQTLTANGGAVGDGFGAAVAISGNTIVVGAASDDSNGADAGTAYTFVFKGLQWSQEAKLDALDAAPGDAFGSDVAIQQDTILVGAPNHANGQGVAYVFERSGTSWSQTNQLSGSTGTSGDAFGSAVAISENHVLIGAPQVDTMATDSGAAYVFQYDGTAWLEQQRLAGYGHFGCSVALSGDTALVARVHDVSGSNDGSTVILAEFGGLWVNQDEIKNAQPQSVDDFGVAVALAENVALMGQTNAMNDIGSVNAYVRSNDEWSQPKALQARRNAAHDEFGVSVAISGNTAVVGALYDDDLGEDAGAAYVFVYDGTSWTLQQKILAPGGAAGDYFGISVAVSGDRAVIGTVEGGTKKGVVYVFARHGTTWVRETALSSPDSRSNDYFGYSLAIFDDTILVGAPQADSVAFDSGAAYVYRYDGIQWNEEVELINPLGGTYGFFGASVALSGKTALVGQWDDGSGQDMGQVEVFSEINGSWAHEATLTANDRQKGATFGFSVSMSGDTVLVGAPFRDGVETNDGAAYVFVRNGSSWSQQAVLVDDPPKPSSAFGSSIALRGNTALIGSYWDDPGGNEYQGAAHLFSRSETTWIERTKFIDPDGVVGQLFGISVALSEDASLGLVGANGDNVVGTNSGSVSVYQIALSLGLGCTGAAACASGYCVDGVCCNAKCDGPCQSCAASTNAFGTSGVCGPAIDGTEESTCAKDPKNPCGNTGYCKAGTCEQAPFSLTSFNRPICLGDFRYEKQICNGLGSLVPDPNSLESCGAYKCDPNDTQCRGDCNPKSLDEQCAAGFQCSKSKHTCILIGLCGDAGDCADDEVCDETLHCVPRASAITPDVYDDACACSLPGQTSNNPAKPFLALALLALLMRRKTSSRSS